MISMSSTRTPMANDSTLPSASMGEDLQLLLGASQDLPGPRARTWCGRLEPSSRPRGTAERGQRLRGRNTGRAEPPDIPSGRDHDEVATEHSVAFLEEPTTRPFSFRRAIHGCCTVFPSGEMRAMNPGVPVLVNNSPEA